MITRAEIGLCAAARARADLCIYCAQAADEIETRTPRLMIPAVYRVQRPEGLVGPRICADCKMITRSRDFDTFGAKRRFIAKHLKCRDARSLAVGDWTDGEVEELGYVLRTSIEGGVLRRRRLIARLSALGMRTPHA